ncbi:ADP-ribosylation factor [Fragilaria crotonensis]|nr:ADP-ribosylation factor [Fragilaria crotonensis]
MPHVELPQAEFKIVMLGDTSTGKTSLVLRFVEGSYREERPPTTGAFFITKRLLVDSILCKISIWDTAGQPQFRPLAKMYYSHAAAAILCFSYSSRQSWQVTKFWLEELHRNVPAGNIVLCLCACKSDITPHVVSPKEVQELAMANGALLVETSAAKNLNVTQVFTKVSERVLQFQKKERETGLGKIP